jgi:hypothetical protein
MLEKLAYAPDDAGWIRRGDNSGGMELCEPVAGNPRVRAAQTQRRFQRQVTADGSRRIIVAAGSRRRATVGLREACPSSARRDVQRHGDCAVWY